MPSKERTAREQESRATGQEPTEDRTQAQPRQSDPGYRVMHTRVGNDNHKTPDGTPLTKDVEISQSNLLAIMSRESLDGLIRTGALERIRV